MGDDAGRHLLEQRVYSRSSADEQEQDFTDPDTGELLRVRPSVWELMLYDRRAGTEGCVEVLPPVRGDDHRSPNAAKRHHGGGQILATGLATGALIGAASVAIVDGVTIEQDDEVDTSTTGAEVMLEAVFENRDYPVADPGVVATAGFFPESFRLLASNVFMEDNAQIFAAMRTDGAYCLVSVAGGVRTASRCGSETDMTTGGLRMVNSARSVRGGGLMQVVVEWQADGSITWHPEPEPTTGR
ncbi:hypothetical protein WJX64_00450 [Leifsonia sp. YIM 134122]|uniref:Uncharacterized protein n=1 Tax=Leifsonia stereocauli TaxID=3134136 RepID=A0ABU9VZ32_9MICO